MHTYSKFIKTTLSKIDLVALISITLVIIFLLTLWTVYLFPIYPDEIQVRFWLSRLPYDFPKRVSGAPACLGTFLQPVPATMFLPGIINWLSHGNISSIPALRQVGIFIPFLWVTALAAYLSIKVKQHTTKKGIKLNHALLVTYLAGFFITIFSIGVFPLFLVTNRGEQLILPSVALLIAIFLASDRLNQGSSWHQKTGLAIVYFIAVSLILYGHIKGLLLTPLFIVVGWQLFTRFKSRTPLIFATSLLILHIFQCLSTWSFAFKCSELPLFEALLKSFSLDPGLLFQDPRQFFEQTSQSLLQFPKYLHQLGFQEQTDANYLPAIPISISSTIANFLIKFNISIAFIAILVAIPYRYFSHDVAHNKFFTINLVLIVTFLCLFLSAILNIPKNWYDAGYIYSLFIVIVVFFIGENFPGIFQATIARYTYIFLAAVAFFSQTVFIHRYLPAFKDGFTGPGVSIAKYDPIKTYNDLTSAAQACGIDPVNSNKVVVDDYSYLFFQKSQWPMAISYIMFLPDDRSVREFFSKVDSDGLVVNCTVSILPYMPVVKKRGNFCCIPKKELSMLLSLP